ncbi:MAG: type II toxin-antitoxin system RelE/ParE family toxin [Methylococcales bacterium]|nr:type II toxin-antitoxin system RelE/ParE family toxin [Methylococcales bacterium]MDP3838687.1 type II toxin-antitoxin system RelE/ParE family toxin [Methylococcales bacterium]
MTWTIDMTDKALKSLAKLDRSQIAKIKQFLDVDLPIMVNPRLTGKALQGDLKGLWRYRVGNYRLIAQIKDAELLILVIELGHRKDIYKS